MKTQNIRLLITGGAGFIGSNLVKHFIEDARISLVRVVDDLSNGYEMNIEPFRGNSKFEFIHGDITDYDTCLQACRGIDKISHQAALGSVPRSISDPMKSTSVNILGTVNLMHAAKESNVERIVLAFSSSTYGDHPDLPKKEHIIGNPLSPYAVTKHAIEQFAQVFGLTYGLSWVGLRYFNIFGPNQNPNNPYAAVIPLFCQSFIQNRAPIIFGDGETSRDFTYVSNAIQANDLALMTTSSEALNETYNIACGESTSLNEIVSLLQQISGKSIDPTFQPERKGDVKHSLADISKAQSKLGYQPDIHFPAGLRLVYDWYQYQHE